MKTLKLIFFILFLSVTAMASKYSGKYGYSSNGQNNGSCQQFYKLTGIYGEAKLSGFYREQEIIRPTLEDNAQSWMMSLGLAVNASSFFCSPEFITLDLGLEYAPEQTSDLYLTIPDQAEIRTLKKFDVRATFLQNKIVSFSAFYNYAQTYSNREFLTNIKTDQQSFGGVMFVKWKFLPFSVSYNQGKTIQDEVETWRLYSYENKDLEARANKSFGRTDRHELVLARKEYNRVERDFDPIITKINDALLTDNIFFDSKQRYQLRSLINYTDQEGYDTLQRLQIRENFRFKLPANFELLAGYHYYNVDRPSQDIKQQTTKGMLKHKLFQSLYSDVWFELIDQNQTTFDQNDTRFGLDLDYEKKIPGGTLSLAYKYMWQRQENTGEGNSLQVLREEYFLSDGQIVLIKRPYVNESSVQVWDETNSILYQVGLDYLLIARGDYTEIQRVPGGLIPNNSTVYVSYIADVPASYSFDMNNNYFSAGLSLFKKLVNVYYRYQKQDYNNLQQSEALTLDYYTRQIYGLRMEYKIMTGGFEYDDNNSTVLPYQLQKIYVMIQGQFKQKWVYSLNGSYSDYYLLADKSSQYYTDFSALLSYYFNAKNKINFEGGYRDQVGEGINLNLLNARLEYSYTNKKFYFTAGLQTYKRDYLGDIDNYKGAYFRIGRRF